MKFGFIPTQVPMTPDKKLLWEKHEIRSKGAIVLQAVGCDKHIVDALIIASQHPKRYRSERLRAGALLGSGDFGDVHRQQVQIFDLAVKTFYYEMAVDTELHQGLSGLRANVAVAEGIRRLTADNTHVFTAKSPRSRDETCYAFRTPRYFAAVFYPKAKSGCNTWAMSFESGSQAESFQHQPPYDDYTMVLDNACKRVGLEPQQIEYDTLNNIKNLLVRPSTDPGIGTDLIKIDSYAKEPLCF